MSSNFSLNNLIHYLLYPVRALYSREFYNRVLFSMRGVGFIYLLLISAAIAIPASVKVTDFLNYFKALELSTLVGQVPPSYLDKNGNLIPNNPDDAFKIIKNSRGAPTIVVNTDNKNLTGDALKAPLELSRQEIIIHSSSGKQGVAYSSLFPLDSSFSPLSAAEAMDTAFSSSLSTVWSVVTLYFLGILTFNALLTAFISKFIFTFVASVRLNFGTALRVCAFANTSVAILLLAQYFISVPISYSVIAMIPVIYTLNLAFFYRRIIKSLGQEAFVSKVKSWASNASKIKTQQDLGANTSDTQRKQDDVNKNTDSHNGPGMFTP